MKTSTAPVGDRRAAGDHPGRTAGRALWSPWWTRCIVHTGQHYDDLMSEATRCSTRGLPPPALNLEVGSRPDLEQLAVSEERLGDLMDAERARTACWSAVTPTPRSPARAPPRPSAAFRCCTWRRGCARGATTCPRSETACRPTACPDVLFAPTEAARRNLEAEEVAGEVHVTGDVLCDMLLQVAATVCPRRVRASPTCWPPCTATTTPTPPSASSACFDCLGRAPQRVVFPVHPRTRKAASEWSLDVRRTTWSCATPCPTRVMLSLERGAEAVATDSGGVQREAYVWGVPCVTLREETEWIETVDTGWNTLVGADPDRFAAALDRPRPDRAPAGVRRGRRRRAHRRRCAPPTSHPSRRPAVSELGVAVIGCGQMGARHAEKWERAAPRRAWWRWPTPTPSAREAVIGRRPVAWDADWRSHAGARRRGRGVGVRPLRAALRDRPGRAGRRQARAGGEADRHHDARRPAHGVRRPRGRTQADGGPRGALQPRRGQGARAAAATAGSAASTAPRPYGWGRCRCASATPAWRSTWPPTTWTSCSTCWSATSRASTPRAAASPTPPRRTCCPACCASATTGRSACWT